MPKYLTALQYARADDGLLSVANLPLATVRRFVQRAEAMVDAYVGLDARLGGFEPHTVWYQTYWNKADRKTIVPTWPVPLRQALRYRIQVSMLGNGQPNNGGFFANIQPGDIAYNTFNNYVEIVPLQAILYSMLPVMIELGLDPPLVSLDVEVGYYLDQLGEQLDDSGDHLTYYASRGFWATTYDNQTTIQPNAAPVVQKAALWDATLNKAQAAWTQNPGALPYVVYVNGTAQTSGFTVNTTEGSVKFAAPQSASAVVSADYTYQIPDAIAQATLAQTTYLLAQRELARQGLRAADIVQTDQQSIRRHNRVQINQGPSDEPSMDPIAIQLLQPYKQWAVG